MTFLAPIRDSVEALAAFAELQVPAGELPASVAGLSDRSVRELLELSASLSRSVSTLQAVVAGVAANRSRRERGHTGFAAESGHRTPSQLVQELTGMSKGEASRLVRVGEALLGSGGATPIDGDDGAGDAKAPESWDQPLADALLSGRISTAQHHAIRTGLGAPPVRDDRDGDAVVRAWRAGAIQLAEEAALCTVEDLGARARALRDLLDPATAEERFAARFAKRSVRWSTDSEGLHRAYITFDDEMAAWVRAVREAALSPRRGGPRFTTEQDRQASEDLANDPRSTEQLEYDLFADLLRAGALASAEDVFGAREAGVRLVAIRDRVTGEDVRRDALDRLSAVAHTDDGDTSVPGSVLDRALCTTGAMTVTVDTSGTPLDVGREHRLFTPRQRVALAVRDGGCVWPGCDRPPSACEAHHIDHWSRGGRTDCESGVLLCRFHHLHLHNTGWRIKRDEEPGTFVLHPPPSTGDPPIPLRSRSPLRWLWDPPPHRASWREG